jgi:hypothetical protein
MINFMEKMFTAVTAPAGNFLLKYRFADNDLRVTNGGDNLNLAAGALTSDIDSVNGLAANTDMVATGTQSLTIPAASCTSITHLCVQSDTTGYTELNTANNWRCLDISKKISCTTGRFISISLKN